MLMCASPLKFVLSMVSCRLKVLDPCNHFNGKKVQVVFIHHIQLQIVGQGADPAAHNTNSITCVTNTLEGRCRQGWAIAMGAAVVPCPHPRQTLSPAPHNRLPPRPQAHLTTTLVRVVHPPPMNSRPRLSGVTEGMKQCPPKCPHIR